MAKGCSAKRGEAGEEGEEAGTHSCGAEVRKGGVLWLQLRKVTASGSLCSVTLGFQQGVLKPILFFLWQRPPGNVPAVLLGFQPALALTGALCLQQVRTTQKLGISGRVVYPLSLGS